MNSKPLVTIICLSMNHEKYIKKSFQSAVRQTYRNIEIFYVDNHSSDASWQTGDEIFRTSGLPYRGIKREKSYGISENINFFIPEAKGKYLTILSADDWWDIDNLEEKISYFETNPHYGMLHGSGFICNYETGEIELEEVVSSRTGWVFKDLLKRNFINTIGAIIKMEAIATVGMFDENSPLEDWDMWLRITEKFQLGFYKKPLVYYGKQPANISANKEFMNRGYEYIFAKYKKYGEINDARKFYKMTDIYDEARYHPSFVNLINLIKNFQFTVLHLRQLGRCAFAMMGFDVNKTK
jgi:glycosyltransferase involved in cell wall biosynthesis